MNTQRLAKGATARATLDFLGSTYGPDLLRDVLGSLEPAQRRRLEQADVTAELAYEDLAALWRSADRSLRDRDPQWVERSGAFSIESRGVQYYSGILRKRSPSEFLTQSVSLFQLFYSPGDMQVVEEEPARAVLRLVGFESLDTLFCRRQTGGLVRALQLAGGEVARVKHVRCEHEGDAFCEWELKWRVNPPTP